MLRLRFVTMLLAIIEVDNDYHTMFRMHNLMNDAFSMLRTLVHPELLGWRFASAWADEIRWALRILPSSCLWTPAPSSSRSRQLSCLPKLATML